MVKTTYNISSVELLTDIHRHRINKYPVLLMKNKNRIASLPVSVIFVKLRSRIGTFVYTMPEKF
jgi:hypothetical protein